MMAGTVTIILGLCLVGGVAWAVLLWYRERAFRAFLCASVALHGLLFFIPSAKSQGAPGAVVAEARLIPYTIIQGADEPAADAAAIEAQSEQHPDAAPRLHEAPTADLPDENALAVEPERAEAAAGGRTEPDLPKIEAGAGFKFGAHPGAASYRKELQRVIQRDFEVPAELDERGYEGRLKVWLNLGRDGRLNYAFLDPIMRSEDPEINRLTEENLHKIADKFPPFPEGVTDYDVSFYVIVDYRNLRNR
jgi:hypothetical protein